VEGSPRTAHAEVCTSLEQLVRSGAPGDRLPAERALAARLGVGRALVRHALRDLEHAGLIDIRAQSGSFVARERATIDRDGR
jgi:GntR family transcriptional regulator, transcriptional repressor for pyruvate dehydrogenase complex